MGDAVTAHVHRIMCVVPENRVSAVGSWWSANLDPADDLSGWPPLTAASGAASSAATHRWCGAALTDAQAKAVLFRLCDLAGVAKPTNAQWNGWSGAQKRSWLVSVRDAVVAGYGIYVRLADNVGTWDEPGALLTASSLRRRVAVADALGGA